MRRFSRWGSIPIIMMLLGCVDGKTPDCTSPDSGCFPTDSGFTQPDSSDASGQSDASDASSDVTPSDSSDSGDATD